MEVLTEEEWDGIRLEAASLNAIIGFGSLILIRRHSRQPDPVIINIDTGHRSLRVEAQFQLSELAINLSDSVAVVEAAALHHSGTFWIEDAQALGLVPPEVSSVLSVSPSTAAVTSSSAAVTSPVAAVTIQTPLATRSSPRVPLSFQKTRGGPGRSQRCRGLTKKEEQCCLLTLSFYYVDERDEPIPLCFHHDDQVGRFV